MSSLLIQLQTYPKKYSVSKEVLSTHSTKDGEKAGKTEGRAQGLEACEARRQQNGGVLLVKEQGPVRTGNVSPLGLLFILMCEPNRESSR